MWQTWVTRGAAGGAVGWARRLPAHPLVAGALAGGQVSASWARQICDWSDLLPAARRDGADQVLLAAASRRRAARGPIRAGRGNVPALRPA